MKLGSIYRNRNVLQWRLWALLGCGGMLFNFPGCDPEVRSALVNGLGSTLLEVLKAKFTGQPAIDEPTIPTVMLDVIHSITTMLA